MGGLFIVAIGLFLLFLPAIWARLRRRPAAAASASLFPVETFRIPSDPKIAPEMADLLSHTLAYTWYMIHDKSGPLIPALILDRGSQRSTIRLPESDPAHVHETVEGLVAENRDGLKRYTLTLDTSLQDAGKKCDALLVAATDLERGHSISLVQRDEDDPEDPSLYRLAGDPELVPPEQL